MDPATIPRPIHISKMRWLVPSALIFISLIPMIAGATRLTELAGGAPITPQNSRFFGSPIPVVTHIVSATTFCLLGAFQFVPALRRGKRGKLSWHRVAGCILAPAGLLAALSGLWMAVFYNLPPSDGVVLLVLRLIFGSAMAASIALGFLAVRRRDYIRHSKWMTRGYAIGLGAGTQALVMLPWILLFGPFDVLTRAGLMGASWAINLAVAEYFIRRRSQASGRPAPRSGRPLDPEPAASL